MLRAERENNEAAGWRGRSSNSWESNVRHGGSKQKGPRCNYGKPVHGVKKQMAKGPRPYSQRISRVIWNSKSTNLWQSTRTGSKHWWFFQAKKEDKREEETGQPPREHVNRPEISDKVDILWSCFGFSLSHRQLRSQYEVDIELEQVISYNI